MNSLPHSGVCVSNLLKSYTLYTEILGWSFVDSNVESGEYIKNLLGLDKLTWVKLKTQDSQIIELYWFKNAPLDSFNHVAFTTKNIKQLRFQLIDLDIKCSQIMKNKTDTILTMFFKDYDNNLFEVMEKINEKL